uniref:Uncharacterized protein n=1 Tax=Rhizophora mucronata TaxID=61149 RepID=A0A2P2PCP9_RHIMU
MNFEISKLTYDMSRMTEMAD